MDIIEFRLEPAENYEQVVQILINGLPLLELAEGFEIPRYKLQSHYVGVPIAEMRSPLEHFRGSPDALHEHEGRVQVLGCSCGTSSCWPLDCRISIGDSSVGWSDFFQPHRSTQSAGGYWSYDGFGPFVFARAQYDQALAAIGTVGA